MSELDYDDDYYDVDSDLLQEEDKVVQKVSGRFYQDVELLAKQYIEHFFKDKMFYCGGGIPKSRLLSKDRISMVLDFDIIQGVTKAYGALERGFSKEELKRIKASGEISQDIKLVNDILTLLSKSGIPSQFAGGLLCLYLEFVEGVEFAS